jgi:hypothetical protein
MDETLQLSFSPSAGTTLKTGYIHNVNGLKVLDKNIVSRFNSFVVNWSAACCCPIAQRIHGRCCTM